MRLFFEDTKFDLQKLAVFALFFVLDQTVLQVRFQIFCYLLRAVNLDIPRQGSEAPLACITFYNLGHNILET